VIIKNGDKTPEIIMVTIRKKVIAWYSHKPEDNMRLVVMRRLNNFTVFLMV